MRLDSIHVRQFLRLEHYPRIWLQTGNGVILMKKKIWFVINSSHDWSLKCIFFKWNIKKHFITFPWRAHTRPYNTYIHTYTHSHSRIIPRHIYLFSRFIWHIRAIVLQLWVHPIRFISSCLDFQRDHGCVEHATEMLILILEGPISLISGTRYELWTAKVSRGQDISIRWNPES